MIKRTLLTLPLCTALLLGLYLAGCDATTPGEPDLSQALLASKGEGEKIDICHLDDEGGYHSINVAVNAEAAHRRHGDGQVGDPVPGMEGYVFDENCVPVEVTCPCWDASDLLSVTAANELTEGSCSARNFLYPRFASIQNIPGSTPSVESGFAAALAGVVSTDPVCLTRDLPPGALHITPDEATACIQQIVDRCAAIGDPVTPPPGAASKAPSRPFDPAKIFDLSSAFGSQ